MPPKASPPNPKARPAGASIPSARKTAASKPNSAVRPKPGAVSVASKQNPSRQTAPSPGKKPPINKTGPAAVTSEDQEVAELKDMFTAKGTISSVPEAAAAADPGPRGSAAEGAMKSRRTSTSKKDAVQLPPEQDPLDENLERLSTAMDAFISQADEREKEVASLKERSPLGIALAAKTKTGRASDLMKRLDVEGGPSPLSRRRKEETCMYSAPGRLCEAHSALLFARQAMATSPRWSGGGASKRSG